MGITDFEQDLPKLHPNVQKQLWEHVDKLQRKRDNDMEGIRLGVKSSRVEKLSAIESAGDHVNILNKLRSAQGLGSLIMERLSSSKIKMMILIFLFK